VQSIMLDITLAIGPRLLASRREVILYLPNLCPCRAHATRALE